MNLFGGYFSYFKYIECDQGNEKMQECEEAKVIEYPLWVIGEKKLKGEQTLEALYQAAACE